MKIPTPYAKIYFVRQSRDPIGTFPISVMQWDRKGKLHLVTLYNNKTKMYIPMKVYAGGKLTNLQKTINGIIIWE